jgi:hypothetical protein
VTTEDFADISTLGQAHDALRRQWPGRFASDAAWLAYHERAAGLYAHIARVDADHHHEALFWASQERESARCLADKISDRQEV